MRKWAPLAAVLVLLLAIGGCSNKKEIEAKDQEIAELQNQISELESDLTAERNRAEQLSRDLEVALSEYQKKEQVLLEKIDNKSVITVSDAMMFSSGSTQLTQKAAEMLDKIGAVLQNYPDREVRVEGHTDNVGIALEFQDRFKSNWELSTARATSVLHYMRRKLNIEPDRLAAVGYGEYRPVADNATPEGRSANRRVVITVGPRM